MHPAEGLANKDPPSKKKGPLPYSSVSWGFKQIEVNFECLIYLIYFKHYTSLDATLSMLYHKTTGTFK